MSETATAPPRRASGAGATVLPRRVIRTPSGRRSLLVSPRAAAVVLLLMLATAAVGVLALGFGYVRVAPLDVLRTLLGNGSDLTDLVVLELRLPRVLTGILVGAALGISGAVFQSLTRNALGSPDIIGFNYGAATGGLVVITVIGGGTGGVATGAVAGGLATAALVYLLAWRRGVQGFRLVLVGIGISAILQSVNFYLMTTAKVVDATRATVWLTGSLNNRGWEHVQPLVPALLVLLPAIAFGGRRLRTLELGDEAAGTLGVPVERSRLYLLGTATIACATATAAAGPIAFVALTAPQLARQLTRVPGPNLGAAAAMGALIVASADFAIQHVGGATALPVGVATGAIGGVYLGWLLWRQRRRGAI